MEQRRRLARRATPFAAAAALGFALVPVHAHVAWGSYGAAAGLTLAIMCTSLAVPWSKLPRTLRIAPSLLYLVAMAMLRDAGGGTVSGVGALALLPVFWLALHGTRVQLAIIVAAVCGFFVAPALIVGGAAYPAGAWRIAVVFASVAAIIGLTVQTLVARLRRHAAELAARERDVETIAALARRLSASSDAREQICTAACDLSDAAFAILLEEDADGALAATAQAGVDLPDLRVAPRRDPSWARAALASRTSLFVADPGDRPDADTALHEAVGEPDAILFEPVHRGEDAVGVLVVGWSASPRDHRRATGLVRLLASEAAFAIERADLLGRLTEIALTDALTGLPNRRAWDTRLAATMRTGGRLCVAMLDLDHFKSFNDRHGHQAGDRLLKETTSAWQRELRPRDLLARYGGEEFAVVLPDCELASAQQVIDRLRRATPGEQSCSAGVACREPGDDVASLLARADHALYAAKRDGRDRTLTA